MTTCSHCHFRIVAWPRLQPWRPAQVCHWPCENIIEQWLAGTFEIS